jgi:hypothetical protein
MFLFLSLFFFRVLFHHTSYLTNLSIKKSSTAKGGYLTAVSRAAAVLNTIGDMCFFQNVLKIPARATMDNAVRYLRQTKGRGI